MVTRGPNAGFTLPEALVTVAIVAVVASLGGTLMTQAQRYFISTRARADLQKEARGIMYVLTRELRQAQNASIVISRAAGNQPYYSEIAFTKEQGTQVRFLQNGNLLCQFTGASGVTLTKNGRLACASAAGQAQALSSHLRYLTFSFPRSDDMTILSVSMTLQTSTFQGQVKALHMASEKVQIMN